MKQPILPQSTPGTVSIILSPIAVICLCTGFFAQSRTAYSYLVIPGSLILVLGISLAMIILAQKAMRIYNDHAILVMASRVLGLGLAVISFGFLIIFIIFVIYMMTHPLDLGPW